MAGSMLGRHAAARDCISLLGKGETDEGGVGMSSPSRLHIVGFSV